jgi:adenylate cyclase class IV
MGKEYEAKFLDIDVEEIKKKLKKLGGHQIHPMIRMVRCVYYRCDIKKSKISSYARVRDEGKGVTMTVKIFNDPDFPDEYEVSLNNTFEEAQAMMTALNLKKKAFQESYREKWMIPLQGVHEIVFDTLPGLPTYIEVDCTTESSLHKAIEMIGLDKTKMRFGAFDRTYEEYYGIPRDVINLKTSSLSFSNIINEIKPRKNKELLREISKKQSHLIFKNSSKHTSKHTSRSIGKKTVKKKN